jgi:tetratricopeptide (TPR) repeat protein
MFIFAVAIMISWIPIVLLLFAVMPPRRAVIVASLTAWMFLPQLSFNLPGIPDYTRTSATTMALIIGAALFDTGRLLSIRPRWFDIPVVAWCLCPFITSLTNDLGPYDGLSCALAQFFRWGFPYLIGRVYLDDLEGLRDLVIGIVVVSLIYVPLCLWEIRMSPQLARYVYGVDPRGWEGTRYSGYRPKVFLETGLELGMWMTAASLCGYGLWISGALRRLWGYPFGLLFGILLVTTVLCKSTGALLLLLVGVGIFWSIQKLKWIWPVWVLLALAPVYESVRTTKLWGGREAVDVAASLINAERAWSLEFRMINEDMLVDKAMQRPAFGWGGWGRGRVYDETGKDISITDGYWIIILGEQGVVGLTLMTTTFLLPLFLLIVRIPPRSWIDPRYCSAAVMAVLLGLYMIDNLSNAMLNPLYALAIGGLTALDPGKTAHRSRDEEEGDRATGPEPDPEAEEAIIGAASLALEEAEAVDDRHRQAEGQRARAGQLATAGRPDAALDLFRRTIRTQEELVARHPAIGLYRRSLARTCIDFGQILGTLGRPREMERLWRRALDLLAGLAEEFPDRSGVQKEWLDHLNNLAWLLATAPDPAVFDPARAASWAAMAVERAPDCLIYWNTLGVAHYRAGHWREAIEALGRSAELGSGGTSFDHFYLALAYARSGDRPRARLWYERGVAWIEIHRSRHTPLLSLRDEVATALADSKPQAAAGQLTGPPATPRQVPRPASTNGTHSA